MGRKILDDEGENQAVRVFLMMYGNQTCTVAGMQRHMAAAGFPFWPKWVETENLVGAGHLTKGGAQDWLRYLFGLEDTHNG